MDSYERLVNLAEFVGIDVIEKNFKSSAKGLCKGNKIGISKEIESTVEKRCVLAEEMAHSLFTCGDILDINNIQALKQEMYARKVACESLVTLDDLINAWHKCAGDFYNIPNLLEVTPEFLAGCLQHYQNKFGNTTRHKGYTLCFSPFEVCL